MLLSKQDLQLSLQTFSVKLTKLLVAKEITKDQYYQGIKWYKKNNPLTESEIKDLFNSPYPNNPDNSKH